MINFKDRSTQVFYSIKFIFILRYQFMLLKTHQQDTNYGQRQEPNEDYRSCYKQSTLVSHQQLLDKVLSVKTHWWVATDNTKSREAAGALASTSPSVNSPDPGTRRRFRRCRACHLIYTRSGGCERAFDDLPTSTDTCKH